MQRTSVLIIDDHRAIIEGIKSAISPLDDFEVIGECVDGQEAMPTIKANNPDVVILDISMPKMNGVEIMRQIQKQGITSRVIIYTMHSNKQFIIDLFKYGIAAYVLKDEPLTDLIHALEVVKIGGTYFSKIAPTVLARRLEELENSNDDRDMIFSLSEREREVFLLLAQGESIKKIAVCLHISPKTVESHKYNIMEKLQVDSVVALTKLAIRKNLINA